MPHVFLTIDTELAWRHHSAGLPADDVVARSLEPAGVGVAYTLDLLARHGLKACFFVDPMPALVYGLGPIRGVVEAILAAGQEVQLHFHGQWTHAQADDRTAAGRFELWDYGTDEQQQLIGAAADLLQAAGAPRPNAFRAGSYAADEGTVAALERLGFTYDSSHNGAEAPRWSRLDLPRERIAPVEHGGLIEVPVTTIADRPGALRSFQPCALSGGEQAAALDHAIAEDHAAVTIVSHSFELSNRAGTRPNAVHVRRFEALCRMLEDRRAVLPTTHFSDWPELPLERHDQPLGPRRLRTARRQAEQLWSNWVEERAA
ncbi:polysaccharide deacetylase family protein [Sphingomonas sp.]|jgi:peptidoglycan/xylan/chitin deacetylase (PgdA/CDA1 family)|uniref:polysaccharide deacetylase family protein n=1 Tax=Sphingomonas sp. TaxID=28214 RepID=UPI002D7F34D9|nr:polysaccharide deacetylase family protein [Sphingomonas sp.]HEU0044098.1 polysaccharide deacetylase family protein [Sphingomonas sp.]